MMDRLLIEPLSLADAVFIYELLNTDEWLRFIGNRNINSIEDATHYINKIINDSNVKYWVVKLKNGDTKIGIITFLKRNYLQYRDIYTSLKT